MKVFAKWIPLGHADSKYDTAGNKKGAEPVQTAPKIPSKREQLTGTGGKLEVYPLQYTHPYALDVKERYLVELQLSGPNKTLNQSMAKTVVQDGSNNIVNLKDIRVLPINN